MNITWTTSIDGKCACHSYDVEAGQKYDDFESRHTPVVCFNAFGESYRIRLNVKDRNAANNDVTRSSNDNARASSDTSST